MTENLPRVKSDPLLLHQVFLNMVMNAGTSRSRPPEGRRIEIATSVAPAGDRIVATVRDTRRHSRAHCRAFSSRSTPPGSREGTGLGLAITCGIVQEHGGQIITPQITRRAGPCLLSSYRLRRHQDAEA
jgi:signal transduction histidine kinase